MTQERLHKDTDNKDTDKTLREYIVFLKENGFNKEAEYYETEVVKLLKSFCPAPLDLTTAEVVATIYSIKDSMVAAENAMNEMLQQVRLEGRERLWEVDLGN